MKIIYGSNLVGNIDDIISDKFALILCDSNTYLLIHKYLKFVSFYRIKIFIFPASFILHQRVLDKVIFFLLNKFPECELVVSVGSGTLSDLCKLLSFLSDIPCILFPTAPSVNAYTSSNSSIFLNNGEKTSLISSLPCEIYIDSKIISSAPKALIASGFADLVCSSTVKMDCLLSHLLFNTYYDEDFFSNINDYTSILLKNHNKILNDHTLIMMLMDALIFSGLGMYFAKSSIVASQGEHQIAHLIEKTLYHKKKHIPLHGEMVAIGTLHMLHIQKKILKKKKISIHNERELFNFHFLNDKYSQISLKKINDFRKSECITKWNEIREILNAAASSLDERLYYDAFSSLSLPSKWYHIGLSKSYYKVIFNHAFSTRDRFTFLDLAHLIDNI